MARREDATESEPFLVGQHYANDIELGERNDGDDAASPTEAGTHSGDHGHKLDASPRNSASGGGSGRRFIDGSGNVHRTQSFIDWLWNHFPSVSGGKSRQRTQSCLSRKGTSASRDLGACRWILCLLTYLLMFLGALQLLGVAAGVVAVFFPGQSTKLGGSGEQRKGISRWPTDFTADILPVRCHSHNDYWRKVPLFSALEAGCTGVEADVWLQDSELYVGHAESALTPNRTFKSLYVDPLTKLLDKQNPVSKFQPYLRTPRNGVFDTDAERSLVLLVDFKTNGDTLWPVVEEQLEALRSQNYLTYFNGSGLIKGPVIVVATGNAPFHKVVANSTYRDIFFDAPLPELAKVAMASKDQPSVESPPQVYDPAAEQAYLAEVAKHHEADSMRSESDDTNKGQGYSGVVPSNPRIYTRYNSYYASTSLQENIGSPFPYFSSKQRQEIELQIQGAHIQGLQVRYWGVPSWPVSWRHYLWRELIQAGIDYLNVDDLLDATKGDWLSQGSLGRLIWGRGGW